MLFTPIDMYFILDKFTLICKIECRSFYLNWSFISRLFPLFDAHDTMVQGKGTLKHYCVIQSMTFESGRIGFDCELFI